MKEWINDYMQSQKALVDAIPADTVERIIRTLRQANRENRQIFVFGNGGSASNASHFITDMGKGASDKMGRRFRCMSLNEHMGWITAIANDYAYEDIFMRQLENFANPGDVVITMSVSGNSPNLVKAFEWANRKGLHTIAMVGGKRGRLAEMARDVIVVDSTHYGRVEDTQMMILHILCYAFMERPELKG